MEPVTVRPCAVDELLESPDLPALLAEYAQESAIDGLGKPEAQFDTYRQLEALGALQFFAAFHGGHLVGFLIMVVTVLPHYGAPAATTESFFVANSARKTGAGLKLLHEAEQSAKALGAVGFLVSAPTASRLASVLPGVGYVETNRTFFRSLA